MFDYLNDLITNNADGTVTIGGVTYATDGSGIIDNYGGTTQDGATSGSVFDSDLAAMEMNFLEVIVLLWKMVNMFQVELAMHFLRHK